MTSALAVGDEAPIRPRRRKHHVVVLALILVVAGLLRFAALRFGEMVPAARPDESVTIGVLSIMPTIKLPPGLFLYGGGYFYSLYGFVWLWGLLRWPGSIVEQIARDPFSVHVVVRAWSAILSTVTVALAYAVGTRLSGSRGGLIAASLLATGTLAIREAHFGKPDTAAAFATALLMVAMARPWTTSDRRAAAIGAAGGLALSIKACLGLLPAVIVALALVPDLGSPPLGTGLTSERRVRSLLVGLASLTVVVLSLNVFCVLQPVQLWTTIHALPQQARAAHWVGGDVVGSPLRYHANVSLRYGCGAAFALLTLPALVLALWSGATARLIAIAVLGYWVVPLSTDLVLARYILPSIPGLAVLVAHLVVRSVDRLRGTRRRRAVVTLALVIAIVAEPLRNGATLVYLLNRPDTRALAADWITANVPENARLASFGAPSIWTDYGRPPAGLRKVYPRLPPARWDAEGVTFVVSHSYPMPYASAPLPPDTPGLQRVAIFDPFDGPLRDPILEPMDAFFLPLAHFAGITRPGPRIDIYAVRP